MIRSGLADDIIVLIVSSAVRTPSFSPVRIFTVSGTPRITPRIAEITATEMITQLQERAQHNSEELFCALIRQ